MITTNAARAKPRQAAGPAIPEIWPLIIKIEIPIMPPVLIAQPFTAVKDLFNSCLFDIVPSFC